MRRHDQTTILAICTVAFFVTFFARMAISPVIPFISEDFSVTNTQIGIALSGMWLAYGLAQYPSGILGDRFGERTIVLLAVGGTTVMSFFLALSTVFAIFVVFVVVLGGFAGLHYSPATALLARTNDNLGRAVGVHMFGSPAAGLIAPIVAAWVAVRWGWRPAVATALIVGIPTYALIVWGVPKTSPRRPDESIRSRLAAGGGGDVLLRPAIAFTLLIAMLGTFVIQGLLSFLPMFLGEYHGYSATVAGIGFSAFFVLRAISQFLLGTISDTYGRDTAIAGAMAIGAIGLSSLVILSGDLVIAVAVGLSGFGMGFLAVIDPRFIEAMGEKEQGAGFGFVRTFYTVFGAAGSVAVGFLADTFGWDVSILVLSGMLAIATIALLVNRIFTLGY